MIIESTQVLVPQLFDLFQSQEILSVLSDRLLPLGTILAQRIEDVDVLADIQNAFNNFVQTGQVWALLIGMFFGYMFKGFTSF